MKILLEKYKINNTEEILPGWTTLFNDINELFSFIEYHKEGLFGGIAGKYKIVIRNVEEYKAGDKTWK